jgi:hypothetical protein
LSKIRILNPKNLDFAKSKFGFSKTRRKIPKPAEKFQNPYDFSHENPNYLFSKPGLLN